jgi:ketosteroid isomerase-like protein
MSQETGSKEGTGLADRFYRALRRSDTAECERLFTADAVIWHNFDLTEKTPAEALAPVAAMSSLDARLEVVEHLPFPSGWLQQHRLHFSFPDGEDQILAIIQRVFVRDGLIARVDEYMDTGQLGRIIQQTQSSSAAEG